MGKFKTKMSKTKNNITIFPESNSIKTQPTIGFSNMGKVDSEEIKSNAFSLKIPRSLKTKLKIFDNRKMSVKQLEKVSLPKIFINDVDASTLPSTNFKNKKFVLQKVQQQTLGKTKSMSFLSQTM